MAETSSIEWTDATWNPIAGCSLKSPGCTHCYAMPSARRHELMMAALGRVSPYAGLTRVVNGKAVWTGDMRLVEAALTLPLRWQRPRRIFVNSMSDLFHESVPDEWINRVFAVMALCPQHTFQVLTKRADRMRAYLSDLDTPGRIRGWIESHEAHSGPVAHFPHLGRDGRWPLSNVWLGVSAEDQRRADERVPDLLATPAAVRFVSAEPLLGAVDFTRIEAAKETDAEGRTTVHPKRINSLTGRAGHYPSPTIFHVASHGVGATLDWIIVGGESGPGARPMHPDWARQIRDACAAAGVAYLFKQWGAYQHGSTMGRAPSLDRIVFNDGRMLTDVTMPACKAEDRENGWHARAPEMMALVGKKAAGRLLDGVEHNGFPEVSRG